MSNDEFVLGAQQCARIEIAMRRAENWTPEMVHKSTEGDLYRQFGDVVLGTHEIVKKSILYRLYPNEKIFIGTTTGQETIANSSKIFTGFLSRNFEKLGTNKPSGRATEPTPAEVYEIQKNAAFREMFYSLGRDIDDLCWEQGQIINFCRGHRDKLHPKGWGNFFLFKVEGIDEPFVADVVMDSGELGANVFRFGSGRVWYAEDRDRVVVPQLIP